MYERLLIDGKNILYRAYFAAKNPFNKQQPHPLLIFFKMLNKYRKSFNPDTVHVFWDVNVNKLWRKKIYSPYKDGRSKTPDDLKSLIPIAMSVLFNMKITQYIKESNEADDLIYSCVQCFSEDNHVIVSSDSDILQILYKFSERVKVYDPHKDKLMDVPKYDPVIIKALTGDDADNIEGYRGVAKLTAEKIIREGVEKYLEKKGDRPFKLNKILIDLSKNPYLSKNEDYVRNTPINTRYNINEITKLIDEHDIKDLKSELPNCIIPFGHI
jgi:DNA polymerase-1